MASPAFEIDLSKIRLAPSNPGKRSSIQKKKERWEPKEWRPEYNRICAYSFIGKSNTWIADQMNFTKEYVSKILNLPQAIEFKNKLKKKQEEKLEESIPEGLNYVAKRGVERMKDLIDNDEVFDKSPFAVISMVMDTLKGLRHLKGGGNGSPDIGDGRGNTTIIGTVNITPEQRSNILDGLERIKEVRSLHSGSFISESESEDND